MKILNQVILFSTLLLGLDAQSIYNYYSIISTTQTFNSLSAIVQYNGPDEYYLQPLSPIIKVLNFTATFDANSEFTILITDNYVSRFTLAYAAPFPFTKTSTLPPLTIMNYNISLTSSPFSFTVTRLSTNETIFTTAGFNFIYSDIYLEYTVSLPSSYLYGLGERASSFLYQSGTYTIWPKDQFLMLENGTPGHQKYGHHPMYLMREQSGNWHIVFLRNVNAMDLVFNNTVNTLTYKIVGGIMELKFFLGDQYPDTSIKMYHNYVNNYTLEAFWAHGYHQSRWGYTNLSYLEEIVLNFTANNVPIDTIWNDLDYMYDLENFVVNTTAYPLADFNAFLQSQNIHWVPLLDIGIKMDDPTYLGIIQGMKDDVFILDPENSSRPLLGMVWPGLTYFPDFNHPNAFTYWSQMILYLFNQVQFSGLWTDMNEISNFCNGSFPFCQMPGSDEPIATSKHAVNKMLNLYESDTLQSECFVRPLYKSKTSVPKYPSLIPPFDSSQFPYCPGDTPLEEKSLRLDAYHYGGIFELDFHSINGLLEDVHSYVTMQNVLNMSQPFILTRSSAPGSGAYVSHWTGDNGANWTFMNVSISEIFNFQLFGIPMVGADICGFIFDTTEELCARWNQLGAFYPFMRNHNNYSAIPQEPFALGPTVLQTARASFYLRYNLLKYYYSIFVRNQGAGTIFRPVFFDFPNDLYLLGVDTEFLIGSELLVAPALYEGQTNVTVYFPALSKWFNLTNGQLVQDYSQTGQNVTVLAPLNTTAPVFIKAGSLIPVQNFSYIHSTRDLNNTFNLTIALAQTDSQTYIASGLIMGIQDYNNYTSLTNCINGNNCLIQVNAVAKLDGQGGVNCSLSFTPQNGKNAYLEKIYIQGLTFYGVRTTVCPLYNTTCADYDHTIYLNMSAGFTVTLNSTQKLVLVPDPTKVKNH